MSTVFDAAIAWRLPYVMTVMARYVQCVVMLRFIADAADCSARK